MNNETQKVAGMPYPSDDTNESANMIRCHVIADILSARNAHRTGLRLRKQCGSDWADKAFAMRNASMLSARYHHTRYRSALARIGGAA